MAAADNVPPHVAAYLAWRAAPPDQKKRLVRAHANYKCLLPDVEALRNNPAERGRARRQSPRGFSGAELAEFLQWYAVIRDAAVARSKAMDTASRPRRLASNLRECNDKREGSTSENDCALAESESLHRSSHSSRIPTSGVATWSVLVSLSILGASTRKTVPDPADSSGCISHLRNQQNEQRHRSPSRAL